jgi:hypothetical protein
MEKSNNWPHYVTIVSILSTAVVSFYGTMDASSLKKDLLELEYQLKDISHAKGLQLKREIDKCSLIQSASGRLAKVQSEVRDKHKIEFRSDVEGILWETVFLIPQDSKKEFLQRFEKGRGNDDEYGYKLRQDLTVISLKGLAYGSQDCGNS